MSNPPAHHFSRIALSAALFTLASLLAFSCWAFGAMLFPSEAGLYLSCALVFLATGGLALLPALGNCRPGRALRLVAVFAAAFLCYAVLWSGAWFAFRNTFGEIIGSAVGLFAFVAVFRAGMKLAGPSLFASVAMLFLCHSIGYYGGEFLHDALIGRGPWPIELFDSPRHAAAAAKLAWGLGYGLGLGLGTSLWLRKAGCGEE